MGLGGVVISFAAKTRDAIKDLSRLSDELETVDDSTKDIDTSFDTVVDSAEDMARETRRAAQKMADGVRQGAKKVDRETDSVKKSFKEAGRESGAEFIQNVGEGIGSGSGSVTDAVQGTIGGLTNLAASLGGPVGVAAGVAAAGVGVVFSKVKAESEKAAAEVQEMIDLLWEVGSTTSTIAKQKIWEDWQADLQEDTALLASITDAMRIAGITGDEMQGAITGDPVAQQAVVDKLVKVGEEIAANVKAGKPLTEEQRKYLGNQGKIHEALKKQGIEIGKTAKVQADLELLTRRNKAAAEDWADEQRRVYNETHKIKQEMDRIPSTKNINVITTFIDKNGRPVKLGPGQEAALGVNAAATLPPVVVNVHTEGIAPPESARQLVNILETHQVRMGRPRGKPRAVAW